MPYVAARAMACGGEIYIYLYATSCIFYLSSIFYLLLAMTGAFLRCGCRPMGCVPRPYALRRVSSQIPSRFSIPAATANVYETEKYVSEYLAFHYGQREPDYLPYRPAPEFALDFNVRLGQLCNKLIEGRSNARALDVGCAVGAACFEMARSCTEVVGTSRPRRPLRHELMRHVLCI